MGKQPTCQPTNQQMNHSRTALGHSKTQGGQRRKLRRREEGAETLFSKPISPPFRPSTPSNLNLSLSPSLLTFKDWKTELSPPFPTETLHLRCTCARFAWLPSVTTPPPWVDRAPFRLSLTTGGRFVQSKKRHLHRTRWAHLPTPIHRQKMPSPGPKTMVVNSECFGQLWPNGPQSKAHLPLSNNTVSLVLVLKELVDACWLAKRDAQNLQPLLGRFGFPFQTTASGFTVPRFH